MDTELSKFASVNAKLTELYQLKDKRDKNNNGHNEVEMLEAKNEFRGTFFLIQIHLSELFPNNTSRCVVNQPTSPHEMLLGILKGIHQYREYYMYNRDIFKEIGMYVTPNLNKCVWFVEKDLVETSLLTVYARMSIVDMTKLLMMCPIPDIRFYPSKYKIENPTQFENIVNSLDSKKLKTLDFIPFLRKRSMEQIKSFYVYHLVGKIKVVNVSEVSSFADAINTTTTTTTTTTNQHSPSPPPPPPLPPPPQQFDIPNISDDHSCSLRQQFSSSSSNSTSSSSCIFETISIALDQKDIDSIDKMISNVILDITIHDMIVMEGKRNKIKYLPAIASNAVYSYKQFSSHYESLIVPVNVDNIHWFLLVFEFGNKQLHILDPSPSHTIKNLEEKFVEDLKINGWNIDNHSRGLNKQERGTLDCGIFVILYAQSFILYNNFHTIDFDVAKVRNALKKRFAS